MNKYKNLVAVVGAGPAGLFAARKLAEAGVLVALFNRDIQPGGLAEYGIYPAKLKMKEGLRKQFKQILSHPQIQYFGNVKVCCGGSILLSDLLTSGFQAVVIATGAQGTKHLRLPGENLPGVYHAKDMVYHYNMLPPFSQRKFTIGKRVAIVGAGNVMMDIARYLIREKKVAEVIAVVRRGPAEVKFTKKEMEAVGRNLDLASLDREFTRVASIMQAAGQDVDEARNQFTGVLPRSQEPVSATRLRFEFLASPVRIVGEWVGGVSALKVEDNTLVAVDGNTKAKGLITTRHIAADTVIFAIGDKVDTDFCLPNFNDAYAVVPEPRFPVDGKSYEAFDPDLGRPLEQVFLTGWARQASTGLVGVARKDGENSATAVLEFLQTQEQMLDADDVLARVIHILGEIHKRIVTKEHLILLEQAAQEEARKRGLEEYKYALNEEMLTTMGF
ncbi:MAG: FAD-dependent oxidoreductase [Chloroflexota bacterium]